MIAYYFPFINIFFGSLSSEGEDQGESYAHFFGAPSNNIQILGNLKSNRVRSIRCRSKIVLIDNLENRLNVKIIFGSMGVKFSDIFLKFGHLYKNYKNIENISFIVKL